MGPTFLSGNRMGATFLSGLRMAFAGLIMALIGCQAAPTKVVESQKREFTQVVEKTQKPITVGDTTVILDTRASFDFGLNHVRGSILFPWSNLSEDASKGELLKDKRMAAVRLALVGIKPETPVLIVGNGRAGQGAEGRLAWSLLYYGVQDVQVSAVESFRKSMTPSEAPPTQNVSPWTVNPRDEMVVGQERFIVYATHPRTREDGRIRIIDVRSPQEFQKNSTNDDYGTINVEWKQFYTQAGRPDARFKKKLAAVGISPTDRVIVVSNHGVRSSSAAYALISLGFSRVENFIGGWDSLK